MEKSEYRENAYAMIYLTTCAINGKIPEQEQLAHLDLEPLFEVCQSHILTACVAYALESAGVQDHHFKQAKEKAIRKNILLDTERKKILNRLEAGKIWYMPLKGALLKTWYPKLGMRQMSDNDILCDGSYRANIKEMMIDLGFTCEHYGWGNNDAYFKPPVCNFEMHNELFHADHIGKLHEYYEDVKTRLMKDENNAFGYHFRTEDFYIYITAHEYKHFSDGGTGVRSLVDTYIFLRKFNDTLDWAYLATELAKLGIADFEKQNRELAMKVFSGQKLTDAESELLDYYILSGTYGLVQNRVAHEMERVAEGSKARYIFYRIFPSMDKIKTYWPFFYRHKWMIPVLWLYRPFHGLFINRKKIKAELKQLNKR